MTASLKTGFPMILPSGQQIAFWVINGSNANSNLGPSGPAADPTISINGGAPIQLANGIWNGNYPFLVYALGTTVLSTDTITYTASSSWLTTSDGSLGSASGAAVANNTGSSILPAFSNVSKTMRAGYNVFGAKFNNPVPTYNNRAKECGPWTGTSLTFDTNQYPVTWSGSSPTALVTADNFSPNGYPACPSSGVWTVKWDDPLHGTVNGDVKLTAGTNCTVSAVISQSVGNATGNYRTYTVSRNGSPPFELGLNVQVNTQGSGGVAAQANIRIYDPLGDTTGATKFYPGLTSFLAGAKQLRFMDAIHTNNSNLTNYSDWSTGNEFTYGTSSGSNAPLVGDGVPSSWRTITLTSVSQDPNADGYFSSRVNYAIPEFTTSAAHGLTDGQVVTLTMGTLVPCSDTGSNTANKNWNAFSGAVRVRDSTHFSVQLTVSNTSNVWTVTGTTTLGAGNTAFFAVTAPMPIQDMIDLCNTVGADCWFNVPHTLTDAAMSTIAGLFASGLHTGLKFYVEYSNEHWNVAFDQYPYFSGQGLDPAGAFQTGVTGNTILGYNAAKVGDQYYAWRASQHHATARTAFNNQSRASDVIRVFGSQYSNTGVTSNIAAFATANSISYEGVAVAPYVIVGGNPSGGGSFLTGTGSNAWHSTQAVFAVFSPAMCHDVLNLQNLTTPYKAQVASHAGFLTGGATVMSYEGGPQTYMQDGTTAANIAALSRAASRHPRVQENVLNILQQFQDGGMTTFNLYTAYLNMGTVSNTADAVWGAQLRYNQKAGVGDGSDGLFNNASSGTSYGTGTSYENMDGIVSVVGYAMNKWINAGSGGGGGGGSTGRTITTGRSAAGSRSLALSRSLNTNRTVVPGS